MAGRKLAQPILAAVIAILGGCSLTVDVSDIDHGCGSGRKLCGSGHCVAVDDPAYGCTPDHCEPCELTNAIPACAGGGCVVSECLFGFACMNEAGCSANILADRDNCGKCGNICASGQSCSNGICSAN